MSNTLKLGNGKWATGKDTLLSFSDTNNNYKPLAFSFSRDSSGTVINKAGLIETVGSGEPRIDFKDNTKGALLLEPQRSNVITNSETFGSTGWSFVTTGTAIAPIVTNNYATSPDGTQNAQRIQFNLGGGSPSRTVIRQSITSQTDWIVSVWMKSTNGAEQKILWHTTSDTNETTVTGEWKRFTFSRNGLNNSWVGLCLNGGVSSVDTADILVYGFQAEQGSYATSYIPTSGQANGVTRVADSSSQTVPDGVIGQTEGTLFLDFIYNHSNTSISENVSLSDGSSSNRLYIGNVFANTLSCVVIASSVLQFSAITSYDLVIGQRYKAAICYKLNDFSFYVNGVEIATDTSGSVPLMNRVGFDSGSGTSKFYKPTNDVKLYNTRLSNSELAALTTI